MRGLKIFHLKIQQGRVEKKSFLRNNKITVKHYVTFRSGVLKCASNLQPFIC